MGNQSSSNQVGNLYIQTDQAFYIAGDTVTGKVHVNTFQSYPANVLQIKVKGYEESYWQEEHTRDQQTTGADGQTKTSQERYFETHKGKNVFFSHMFPLYVWSGFSYMPAGQYTFPFQFKLIDTLPGTFHEKGVERGGEYKATIKYKVKAEINAMSHTKLKHKQDLVVREPLKTIVSSQFGEKHVKPSVCCCIAKGESHIRCSFERNNYQPGELARMNADIDNSNCQLDIKNVSCNFNKTLRLSSSAGRELRIHRLVQTREFPGVPAGQRATDSNRRYVEVDLKHNSGPIQPSTHGRLINCDYQLNVTANLDGCICCSSVPEVTVPITIVSPPPVNYGVVQTPPNWQPQIFEVKSFAFTSDCMYTKSVPAFNAPPPVSVTMNMPPPQMHVNMNVPPQNVKVTTTTTSTHNGVTTTSSTTTSGNVNMNMGMPGMQMNVSGSGHPPPSHHHQNNGPEQVNINMNMGMGMPGMQMNVQSNGHHNNGAEHVNMNVGMGGGFHDNSNFSMTTTNTNRHQQDGFDVNFTTNDSQANMFGNQNHNEQVNVNFGFGATGNHGNNNVHNPF